MKVDQSFSSNVYKEFVDGAFAAGSMLAVLAAGRYLHRYTDTFQYVLKGLKWSWIPALGVPAAGLALSRIIPQDVVNVTVEAIDRTILFQSLIPGISRGSRLFQTYTQNEKEDYREQRGMTDVSSTALRVAIWTGVMLLIRVPVAKLVYKVSTPSMAKQFDSMVRSLSIWFGALLPSQIVWPMALAARLSIDEELADG